MKHAALHISHTSHCMQHYCTYYKLQQLLTIIKSFMRILWALHAWHTWKVWSWEWQYCYFFLTLNRQSACTWSCTAMYKGRVAHLNTHVQDCQQMSNGTYIGNPKLCCFGWTGKVPHLLHPVLTVHPIPLYHGREWTDWDTYQSVPLAKPCPSHHIPSHPTVPWELRNRQIPKYPTRYTLSVPSHFTMGRNRDCTKVTHLLYTLSLLSIPSHCTMEGMDRWGLYQSVTSAMLCQTCPSLTAVP